MSTCTCDTFSSTTSTPTVSITNTGTGEGLKVTQTTNNANGVEIQHNGSSTSALWANCTSNGAGVTGTCTGSGPGVQGVNQGSSSNAGPGVYASSSYGNAITCTTSGANVAGISATALSSGGIAGYFNGYHIGVSAVCQQGTGGNAIYAIAGNGAKAANLEGDVYVGGTLSKAAGTFTIDHPLDPENKILQHSFVESPDMKNVYDGITEIDKNGNAIVTLPSYFDSLNRDFRYQLTAIGTSAPNLFVSKEIDSCHFSIYDM